MRTHLIIIHISIFFSIVSFTKAQDSLPVVQTKTDSLKQLLNQHNNADEEKVRLLNEYARSCFYDFEYFEGLKATREARILSEELDFEGGKVLYYLTLSVYPQSRSMINYYQKQAEWLTTKSEQNLDKYYVEINDEVSDNRSDWETLLNESTEMLRYFEKLNDKEIKAIILSDITYYNYQLANFEASLEARNKIIQLYKELEQVYPVFNSTSTKIFLLNKLGREEEANKLEAELVEFITLNENENSIGLITFTMGRGYFGNGRYALAIESYMKAIKIFEQSRDTSMLINCYINIGMSYAHLEMYDKSIEVYDKYIAIAKQQNDTLELFKAYNLAIFPNFYTKNYEKAREYMALALQDKKNETFLLARRKSLEGQILKDKQEYAKAIPYFQSAMETYIKLNRNSSLPFMPLFLTECYQKLGDLDKALEYALLCLEYENKSNSNRTKVKSQISLLLSEIYDELGQKSKAYEYLKMHQAIRAENDKLDAANRLADTEVRTIIEKSQVEIDALEKEKIESKQQNRIQRLWILSIAGAFLSALFFAFILFRNNRNKQKANKLLKEQKDEIQKTLKQLKSTQSQLIQSEKMASLGELTAGIAHEIQNPLNFVNNFSEVNRELVDELKEELATGNKRLANEIADDIKENEEKINHHGKRAEAIVKGMLQHSRTNSGEKELTDINALADEYLRLSYHGLRAKDKTFNADFKTKLDESLPKINVIPQDIGRVLLNLINNAFYAANEKAIQNVNDYKPSVVVSTRLINNKVEIRVQDNGNGIPDSVKDKIFQPFFTTKPTGSGTGLGLSLSYDIIKAHGGKITVESNANEGTEFIIQIPNH